MNAPRIRAGDADRQQAVDRLARSFTQGRLNSQEYDERVAGAYASVYLDELPLLFTDLPPERISPQAYEKAWEQGYGPVQRRRTAGPGLAWQAFPGLGRILVIVLAALAVLWLLVESHGFFFPLPLIWIGLLGMRTGRRGRRGPGPRGPR